MDLPTYFDGLMQRSPIPPADIATFLREMRRTPSGALITSKLLASKIQSKSEAQAIHAFDFLEACLESETEGSIEFRTEIGRYRFLNEIIRILSPKYMAEQTSKATKARATEFMYQASGPKRKRWFPSELAKIESVYQSLTAGQIIEKSPYEAPTQSEEEAELQKSIFDRAENAAMLKKLLQSKDPSDLQAANRLIKNLVEEETKRNERRAELHSLIDRIDTSTSLLREMVSQTVIDNEIVEELVHTCRTLREKLGGIATESTEETNTLLQASENIELVLNYYDERKKCKDLSTANTADEKLTKNQNTESKNVFTSLADELLMGLGEDHILKHQQEDNLLNLEIELESVSATASSSSKGESEKVDTFDEISRMSRQLMDQSLAASSNNNKFNPVTLNSATISNKTPLSQIPTKISPTNPLPEENQDSSVSSSLLLGPYLDLGFLENRQNIENVAAATTTTFSNLVKPTHTNINDVVSKSRLNSSSEDENLLALDESQKMNYTHTTNALKLDSASALSHNTNQDTNNKNHTSDNSKGNKSFEESTPVNNKEQKEDAVNFSLSSIKEVDLDKIELIDMKPIELKLDDATSDIGLTLTFGKLSELPKCAVAVATLMNKNSSACLVNYVFQLMPPKGYQVKMLAPPVTELPPWKKSFLPPPVLNQVVLIKMSNQSATINSKIKIRFILSYCLEEETALHNGDFEISQLAFL